MAETERSASPNTKAAEDLCAQLKRVNLEQQQQHDDDDDDENFYDDDEDEEYDLKNSDAQVSGSGAKGNNNNTSSTNKADSSKATMHGNNLQTVSTNCPESGFMHDDDIVRDLPTILSLPAFDPYEKGPQSDFVFKKVVSLMQLSLREDNVIEVEVSKKLLSEYSTKSKGIDDTDDDDDTHSYTELDAEISMKLLCEYSKNVIRTVEGQLRPITDLADIFVKHDKDEFYTFCSCKQCLEYRETIMNIMMDQFKAAHMVVMLLDVLIKAYSPMLKNDSAYNKFEKLLESNKEIYWITSGYLYDKNADYLDFIDDSTISDNMILVLFSSILLANNPMLLLQILAYNVECIVKAFAEGIIEIAQPKNGKIPAEKMLSYVLEGYSDLNCISQKISLNLFAFENDFLRRFKLTWVLLCQRLYQQHVYSHLADTMLACIITLKEDALTPQNSSLIKRYILFDEHMNSLDRRWYDIWVELNKFNTSEVEHVRRSRLLGVHIIFDTVVMDATSFSLPDISDDEFTDFQRIEDRHLAWRNIMAFTKLKWPDGFYDPPKMLVYEDRCSKCNVMLEYHLDNCKCVTCSIAGGPVPPTIAVTAGCCSKCATNAIVERNPKIKKSKILSTCVSDDTASSLKYIASRKGTGSDDVNDEQSTTTVLIKRNENEAALRTTYHIAWAVFQHLTTRKRYRHDVIEPQNFCNENCRVSACLLARKILNNEIAPVWTQLLVRYFQPLSFSREELRATLPSIMFFNRKMVPCNVELREQKAHNYILKTYWTFVLSIYANFFMRFNFPSTTDFTNLEIINKDLRLRVKSIAGDVTDRAFEWFLEQVKRLSPFRSHDDLALLDAHIDQMQKGLDKLMSIHEAQIIKHPRPDAAIKPKAASDSQTPTMTSCGVGTSDSATKRMPCKEKMKKCCLEYSDIGEHCKENHAKKRVKKECNHARYNETRERLRKKFAQIVSERKNKTTTADTKTTTDAAASTKTTTRQQSVQTGATTKDPPTLKCAAANAAAGVNKSVQEKTKSATSSPENSLSCLDNLCQRIQLGKPINNSKDFNEVSSAQLEAARAQIRAKEKDIEKMVASLHLSNSIGVVNEFYEFLDNYTKEQDKKWINEALNFIEGNDKPQPHTKNPKKAAKKAKQKMRKEEEKRIGELHDLRGHFHDIYFKEFTAKQELKTQMASSKKRDKKRISELEANIKKLQRAKANVETGILELIATVKQTSAEFRFTYLPTKEQQLQKMRKLLEDDTVAKNASTAGNCSEQNAKSCDAATLSSTTAPAIATAPANLQQFLDYRNPHSFFAPPLAMPQTPMCYAPPQQQQLPPDVVAAMAANAVTADPSKRIVTIRRVNMPNANEPQVTVTAKGSSPDEDKLLYTFVNGQLVPTMTLSQAVSVPQLNNLDLKTLRLPAINNNQNKGPPSKKKGASNFNENGPTHLLEQKLAKLSLNNVEDKRGDQPQQHQHQNIQQLTKKQQKSKLKTHKLATQSFVAYTNKDSTSSSTTTCSNSTSKSETPLSSGINTRENSVCSLKPNNNTSSGKAVKKSNNAPPKQQQQHQPQQQQQPPQQKQVQTTQKSLDQKIKPTVNEAKPTPKAKSPELEVMVAVVSSTGTSEANDKRQKRSKLVDSGQFDNNPFNTLQDESSESDCELRTAATEQVGNISVEPQAPAVKPVPKVVLPVESNNSKKEAVKPSVSTKKKETKDTAAPVPLPVATAATRKTKQENNSSTSSGGKQTSQKQTPQTQTAPQQKSTLPQAKKSQANAKATHTQAQHGQQQTSNNSNSSRQQESNRVKQQQANTQTATAASNNNNANYNSNNKQQPQQQQQQQHQRKRNNNNQNRSQATPAAAPTASYSAEPAAAPATTSKRSHRSKRYQKQKQDAMSGIPNNMGYFNPNEVAIPQPPPRVPLQHPQQAQMSHAMPTSNVYGVNLCQQMQNLRLGNVGNVAQQGYAAGLKSLVTQSPNVSIMDQLNRGVQVEDLSLPPGITLTKVDPIKSEQLRQRSEAIKKLSKPLPKTNAAAQRMPASSSTMAPFPQTQHSSATIIAAPGVAPTMSSYYAGGGYASAAGLDPSGIIMVETNPKVALQQQQQVQPANVAAAAAAAAASGKSSSRRRRRNKTKTGGGNVQAGKPREHMSADGSVVTGNAPGGPKMVTLRNPMFHANANGVGGVGVIGAASVIQQQQQQQNPMLPGRASYSSGLPLTATLPIDQPAAIIKNDNGMFTIRNPVLHQAVTNGLAISGYRQFGNVNYYTPQEAVAEAARATQQQQQQQLQQQQIHQPLHAGTEASQPSSSTLHTSTSMGMTPTSFSYFSSGMANAAALGSGNTHNNISISCTNVDSSSCNTTSSSRLTGDAAIIARPTRPHAQKCISAIGSELKQKSKETGQQQHQLQQQQQQLQSQQQQQQWSNFGTQDYSAAQDFSSTGSSLQDKYQHTNYYNGFVDVFPTSAAASSTPPAQVTSGLGGNGAGGLFDASECRVMPHSCGDDSPPPTITGFNSYLEGIPNTGVIRYDDAAFLKNLIPGQQLNNEVSIHNISDANYAPNVSPPAPSIYGGVRADVPQSNANSTTAGYCEPVTTDYSNDAQMYAQANNLLTGLPELDFNYDYEAPPAATVSTSSSTSATAADTQQSMIDLNDLLRRSPHSQRASPYSIDDSSAIESFVHNLNALQLAAASAAVAAAVTPNNTSEAEQQCLHLNGGSVDINASSSSGSTAGASAGAEGATAAANGWW